MLWTAIIMMFAGIAFMEVLLMPLTWDGFPNSVKRIFQTIRTPTVISFEKMESSRLVKYVPSLVWQRSLFKPGLGRLLFS